MWSTNKEMKDEKNWGKADITIGSPIANTQIYILDKDGNILPIGVAGELCIAGEGVGMGYLNRPEMTSEKFVPNPFATEENHHGKVMYHTGDLVRWRADGEIEYLGRIDTQVKIRGLRIELGEIESVMSSFSGIQLTAVADKRDESNRQYLVGYYTAEGEIDEKELRNHLSSKLPKYMVPNYFMKLDVMPMTASGKTDRKNLPLPDFSVQTSEYAAPETEQEMKLCNLLKELLHTDRVGVEDDFFEYGGDTHPFERISYLIKDVDARILLTYGLEQDFIEYRVCKLDTFCFDEEKEKCESINSPLDLCYLICTSGSTGTPKCLGITHRNAANFASSNSFNVNNRIVGKKDNTFLSITNTIFDMFITELLIPLTSGKTLLFATEEEMVSAQKLNELCMKYKPDVIETTPTKFKMLLSQDKGFEYVKMFNKIIVGGETLTSSFLRELKSLTKSKIYNNYGPAETTVWSTISLVEGDEITIGKPIANTQIYILDKNQNIVPIGVTGELCIAGDGVGKGYINRSDLTAEKFVPNPYATNDNHHGKIMYHTGDLARWRADGEIEYQGRIDTQVKIHGLRIELGEIESVMSSFAGIQLTAVTDKKDENGRQYLVGYYSAAETIDEKELRNHLFSKLPKYMVPNYFMRLEKMPMTASGKTDRKNLPVPEFKIQDEEYIAPETEQEKCLCEILQEVLHMEKVGINYDFFEYGGDSLGAITYVAQAHGQGINFDLQNVFDYPTVRTLCEFLNCGEEKCVTYDNKDFEKYEYIFKQNVIDESFVPKEKTLGNVLVTGATGFLGAHVVDELMHETDGIIYCLVRSQREDDRRGRIAEVLSYYFGDKYAGEIGNRIVPIIGDIETEGLSKDVITQVDTIIHTAASVKHYGSYSYFYKVNVEGTKHVVDFAKKVGARLVHISTLSVSGNSLADDFSVNRSSEKKCFYENSLYIGQPLDNVYIHSKFEAERRVYDAMLDGLDATVIRVGNLTNRASDYKFQPNYKENAFLTRVKAILEFGLFPEYLMKLYAEFSPIDKTVEGIVKIAQYADKQTVFHLNSDRVIYFDRFLEVVHNLGISMEVVSGNAFNEALQKTIKQSNTEYIFEAFQNDMDEQGHLVYDSNIRIENDFTLWFLKKVGFEWNETDMEYIKGYIDYFRRIGYLEV